VGPAPPDPLDPGLAAAAAALGLAVELDPPAGGRLAITGLKAWFDLRNRLKLDCSYTALIPQRMRFRCCKQVGKGTPVSYPVAGLTHPPEGGPGFATVATAAGEGLLLADRRSDAAWLAVTACRSRHRRGHA
jgi:hypothetical protein